MSKISYTKMILTIPSFSYVLSAGLLILSSFVWAESHREREFNVNEDQNIRLALDNLSQAVDSRIAKMQLIATSIANDTHIHNWVQNGFKTEHEYLLVDKLKFLVDEYNLTSASFADKSTNKYWNHEGFLRVLQPEMDTWYFAYVNRKEQDLVSIYHDKNKQRIDVYVNYQQIDGNGLSGIATSFDGVVDMLNASNIAQNGKVYLVDRFGKVQIQANSELSSDVNMYEKFDRSTVSSLLDKKDTQVLVIDDQTILGVSYIPSMTWYVVIELPH